MAEKDLSEKILISYNDVFADIVNGLIFDGKDRIKASSLSDRIVHSQYKDDELPATDYVGWGFCYAAKRHEPAGSI